MDLIQHEERLQTELIEKIARGEKVAKIDELPLEFYGLLVDTIVTQWNCEYWGGMNYLTCMRLGPTRIERQIVRIIGQEELGHAFILERGPLEVFGINPWEQLADSVKTQRRILRIFQFPEKFKTWAHFLMFNHLQDRSAAMQLARFKNGPFAPWNEAILRIEREEDGHIEHGVRGIQDLAGEEKSRQELQVALNDWLPLALEVFGAPDAKSKSLPLYRKYGLKDSNDRQREDFKRTIKPLLVDCGLFSPLLEVTS